MKIDKAKLGHALGKIGIFVGKGTVNPSVSLVHFRNSKGKAVVFATDMNSAGRAYFDTDEQDDFEFCVEYRQLTQTLKLRNKDISAEFVEDDGNGREIKFFDSRTCFSWAAKPNDSLSEMERTSVVPDGECFVITGKDLKKAIAYGGYARNEKDNQNPFVNGVHFVSHGEAVDIHSTDRHRIAGWKNRSTEEIDGMEGTCMDGILSSQNIKSVSLFDDDDSIRLYITDSQIILVSDDLEAYASKINCQYKDISAFFAKPVNCSYTVDIGDALESLGIIDSDDCNWVSLAFKESEVVVDAHCKTGNIHDSFGCKRTSGGDFTGTFDLKKIKDIFSSVKTKEISIEFRNLNGRADVLTYSTDDGGYGMLGQYRIG